MPTTSAALNASQVYILKALTRSNGMTREALEREVGPSVACTPENLGPAYKETLEGNAKYMGSLWGLGLVRPIYDEVGGEMVPLWHATAKGRQMAASLKTRERPKKEDKVPPSLLDPVVRRFKATRTYGLELYTDDDILAIRQTLGSKWAHVPIEALRLQITARRKQGAFADPVAKIRRCIEKAIREFGPEGSILPILTPAQVDTLERHCADNTGEGTNGEFPEDE
jgi:hypothetical protein